MANVLTQSEIDELLNALSSGGDVSMSSADDEPGQSVRIYDFRTANKFYKEQMRTLNIVFDNFAYLLSNRLTGSLRTLCEVQVVSVEEQIFSEFSNSIPTPAILAVIDMEPLQGPMLLVLSSTLAYAFVSRLFGGVADYTCTEKSFTEIELAVVESIMYQIMAMIKESWEKIAEVFPTLSRLETSSQFTQIASATEPVAIVSLNVTIDKMQGLISLCIPHFAVQPISKQLSAASWMLTTGPKHISSENAESIRQQLENTYVNLKAVFNDTTANLSEILSMKVGDVICLDHPVSDLITVKIEDVPKFKGIIGIHNNNYVVQVANTIEESDTVE